MAASPTSRGRTRPSRPARATAADQMRFRSSTNSLFRGTRVGEHLIEVVEQIGRIAPDAASATCSQRLIRRATAAQQADGGDAGLPRCLGVVGGVADEEA